MALLGFVADGLVDDFDSITMEELKAVVLLVTSLDLVIELVAKLLVETLLALFTDETLLFKALKVTLDKTDEALGVVTVNMLSEALIDVAVIETVEHVEAVLIWLMLDIPLLVISNPVVDELIDCVLKLGNLLLLLGTSTSTVTVIVSPLSFVASVVVVA